MSYGSKQSHDLKKQMQTLALCWENFSQDHLFHEEGSTTPFDHVVAGFMFFLIENNPSLFQTMSERFYYENYMIKAGSVMDTHTLEKMLRKPVSSFLEKKPVMMMGKQLYVLHHRLLFPNMPRNVSMETLGYDEHGQTLLTIYPDA